MTYTSSKFILLKGNCPICLGQHKSCKKNSENEVIHCRSELEAPQGFVKVGIDRINFVMYAPARDSSKPYDHEAARAKREARLAKQARQHEQALKAMPSLEERDRLIREKALNFTKTQTRKLTKPQNTDLLKRGLTQDEINFAISRHWLFALEGGYGIATYDPISRLLCGAQRANDDRTKKYTWGIFTGQNQLKETCENPLFVWQSPDFDSSKPYQIKFCEGALKSLIRAFFEWRTNPQIILIGAAGGIFGSKALERVLRAYPDAKSHTLLPDADSQNIKKLNLYRAYGNLAAAISSLKFADWGHWQQTKESGGKDCDETYGTDAFNGYELRSPQNWLSFFDDLKAKQHKAKLFEIWQKNKAFTPDIRLNSQAVFSGIPIPNVNTIVAVRSDFGTQKTRSILPHLAHWQALDYKVFLDGYRNALLKQTVKVWRGILSNFMLMKVDPKYIRMAGQHLAACLDQLTRNKCQPQDFDKSILVIDEATDVEMHMLMGGTLKDNRSEVFELFCEQVRRAEVIYLMSATLTDAMVKFIADIRGDRTTKVIKYKNDYINKQKFTIIDDVVEFNPQTEEKSTISSRSILRTMATGFNGKTCVVADSQTELEALEIERKKQSRTTFRYDSKTSDTDEGKEFLDDSDEGRTPDDFIEKYKIDDLYISPSGNSGVSITIENYFKAVFGFSFGVLDVDSFLQMPMRIRDKAVERYLAVLETVEDFGDRNSPKQPHEVMELMNDFVVDWGNLSIQGIQGEALQERLAEFNKQFANLVLNNLQANRYAELQAALNYEKANFKECLEWRLNDLEHSFKRLENGSSNSANVKKILENKEEIRIEECRKILNSEDIPIIEARAILKANNGYEESLKATKAVIKDSLPRIDKSELWSAEFIKLFRFDDRDFLKRLDLRYLAKSPDITNSKAVDNYAYLMQLRDNLSPQDIRSPMRFLTAVKDIGLLELMDYKGDDLHKDHCKIVNICKLAKVKTNARRLGINQGKSETNMQFISRLLAKLGYGTKGRYNKAQKCKLYEVRDVSRATIEQFQLDRAMAVFGVKLSELPNVLYQKCFVDGKQTINQFSEFCDEFGLEAMLKICYSKAKNPSQLALIDLQLQLFFASADEAFLELGEAINVRYQGYKANKKIHDFGQILEQKNSMTPKPEIIDKYSTEWDHPLS